MKDDETRCSAEKSQPEEENCDETDFCLDGVSLTFLLSIREHPRLHAPMMTQEEMENLSLEDLRKKAKEMRIFSECPFEEENRKRDQASREELCAALNKPPRTVAQVIHYFFNF